MEQQNERAELIKTILKLVIVGTPEEHQKLSRSIQQMSIPELKQANHYFQLAATNRAKTQLYAVKNGLADTPHNWSLIDQRLGPYFTMDQFRNLVQSDPMFKQSLTWRSEAFADAIREEQSQAAKHSQRQQSELNVFTGAAHAVTGQHLGNIAVNQANFHMVKEALDEDGLDFTTQNVINILIRGGLHLVSNDDQATSDLVAQSRSHVLSQYERFLDRNYPESVQIRRWIMDPSSSLADVSERLRLVSEIVNTIGSSGSEKELNRLRGEQFRKLVLSVTTIEQLSQRVAEINQRRELRSLSPAELRELARQEWEQKHPQHQLPQVPADVTADAIRKASPEQHKIWNRIYGHKAIEARVNGGAQ